MGEEVNVSFYEQRTAADAAYRQKFANSGRPATQWHREAEVWFDGSIESVDRRLAMCDRLLATSRRSLAEEGFTAKHLAAVDGLDRQRGALEDLRHQLLTAGADRDYPSWAPALDASNVPGKRIGGKDRRWVDLEAPRFFRANSDARDDLEELATRAANHVALRTGSLGAERQAMITDAFCREVIQVRNKASRPRTASVERPASDCADEMMFM